MQCSDGLETKCKWKIFKSYIRNMPRIRPSKKYLAPKNSRKNHDLPVKLNKKCSVFVPVFGRPRWSALINSKLSANERFPKVTLKMCHGLVHSKNIWRQKTPAKITICPWKCLFVCLFVYIKPENLYCAPCVWREVITPGNGCTRNQTQTTCVTLKTVAQTTYLSING